MSLFGFQRLHVYTRAIRFVAGTLPLVERLPKGYASLGDQLRRATISIPLNIAEGTGRYGRDAAQFFAIARGSALECAAMIDIVAILVPDARGALAAASDELVHVVNILTALMRKHGARFGREDENEGGGEGGGGESDDKDQGQDQDQGQEFSDRKKPRSQMKSLSISPSIREKGR